MAIEHLVDADGGRLLQETTQTVRVITRGHLSDDRLIGGYCGENPEQMCMRQLEQRICGDVPCESCEIRCGFGREYLRRLKEKHGHDAANRRRGAGQRPDVEGRAGVGAGRNCHGSGAADAAGAAGGDGDRPRKKRRRCSWVIRPFPSFS